MRPSLIAATLGLALCLPGCKSRKDSSQLEKAKALTASQPSAALEQLDSALAQGADRLEVLKAKAAAHQRLHQLSEAAELLRSVLADAPEDREALLQLANVRVAQGNLEEARRHLAVAIRQKPPHVPTLLLFATMAKTKEDGESGLVAFEALTDGAYASFRKSAEYVAAKAALLSARGDGRAARDAWLADNDKSRSFDPKLSLLMADGLARLEKGSLALWLLARASSSPSADESVHEALAERALSMGDLDAAKRALTRLTGKLSSSPNVLLLEARLLELQDQRLEATKLTKRALDQVPEAREKQKTAYALTHARSLAKAGLHDDARTVLTDLMKSEPALARAKLLLAAIEMQAGHPERVGDLVEDLLADPQFASQAQTLITTSFLERKDVQAAKKAARRYFEQDRNDLHARLLYAQTLTQVGEPKPALALLDEAPPMLANETLLVLMRLQLSQRLEDPKRVEAVARDYLRVGVSLPEVRHALAKSLVEQGRLPEAEAVYRELAKDDPNAFEQVARLEREQGRLQNAISTLTELVVTSPSSHSAWLHLALMRREAENIPGAIAAYEQALRLEPNDPVALNNLALLLVGTGQAKGRAITLARRAAAALPHNPALEDTLGWALLEGGDERHLGEALGLLERSSRLLGTPEALFHFGMALVRARQTEPAKRQLSLALAGAASDPPPAWRPRAEQALAGLSAPAAPANRP